MLEENPIAILANNHVEPLSLAHKYRNKPKREYLKFKIHMHNSLQRNKQDSHKRIKIFTLLVRVLIRNILKFYWKTFFNQTFIYLNFNTLSLW